MKDQSTMPRIEIAQQDKYQLGPDCDSGCLDQGVRVCGHEYAIKHQYGQCPTCRGDHHEAWCPKNNETDDALETPQENVTGKPKATLYQVASLLDEIRTEKLVIRGLSKEANSVSLARVTLGMYMVQESEGDASNPTRQESNTATP